MGAGRGQSPPALCFPCLAGQAQGFMDEKGGKEREEDRVHHHWKSTSVSGHCLSFPPSHLPSSSFSFLSNCVSPAWYVPCKALEL